MENKVFKTYGELIKYKRNYLNFSRQEMADYFSISLQTYIDYENDVNEIKFSYIGMLCKKLKIDLVSFLNKKDEMNNDYCERYEFDVDKFTLYLRFARDEKNLSQLQVAKDLNMSNIRVSRIENGTFLPTIDEFKKIGAYLNLDLNYLYFGFNYLEIEKLVKEKKNEEKYHFYTDNKFLVLLTIILSLLIILVIIIPFFLYSSSDIEPPDGGKDGGIDVPPICEVHSLDLNFNDLVTFKENKNF